MFPTICAQSIWLAGWASFIMGVCVGVILTSAVAAGILRIRQPITQPWPWERETK